MATALKAWTFGVRFFRNWFIYPRSVTAILLKYHVIPNERYVSYILSHKPCESPVHILAAIMIIVGDTKSIGYRGRNGTARVNKAQTTPANPKMNSPPYLSLKYPPTTCAGMYPQKNADMIAPWNKQKHVKVYISFTDFERKYCNILKNKNTM